MAFDMGWNPRGTAGYVTDQSFAVPFLNEAYPHTYTNVDGYSVNAGALIWLSSIDRDSSNDPRLAGRGATNSESGRGIQIDLSSGSAPGAGPYTIDLAMGDIEGPWTQDFQVLDGATVLIDGSAGYVTAAHHYIDATLTDVAATTTWTGTPVSKTFAGTTAKIVLGSTGVVTLAHFRLTLEGSAANVRQEHIGFGIGRGILIGR